MRDLMRFGGVVVIFLIGEVLGKEVGGRKGLPGFSNWTNWDSCLN